MPDQMFNNSEQLNTETYASVNSKTGLLNAPANIRSLTFNEIISILTIVHSCSKDQALTEFSDMNTIYGMDTASEMVNNMKKDYLKQRGFNPYIDSDGRYRGYVYWEDDNGKKRRKAISSTDLVSLTCKAMDFYKQSDPFFNSRPMTFKAMFPAFIQERLEEGVCGSTVAHDEHDWKRFLETDPMIRRAIKNITYVEFVSWFKKKLLAGMTDRKTGNTVPFTTKQAKCLRSLLTLLFQYAVDHGYAEQNLSSKMGKFRYQRFCEDTYKPDWDQVYQDDEPTQIMDAALNRFQENHNYAYLAIVLNFFLGLRVGELVALKYSDLEHKPGQIHIQRQEIVSRAFDEKIKATRRLGYEVVEHTKTWQDRFIVMSEAANNVVSLIRKNQEEDGIQSEYLFINFRGVRMHADSVNKALRDLNKIIGTSQKACHSIRKTCISDIRNEISVGAAARFAGHKNLSTTDLHYSFNTISNEHHAKDYSRVIDKSAPSRMKVINF